MEPHIFNTWSRIQFELKSFVYRKVRDKATTEDIVQDVFLKVQGSAYQLKDAEKISGWIYRITHNTIVDHYRRKSKVIKPEELDWESGDKKEDFNECAAHCLGKMLTTLPVKYREALELVEMKNLSQQELAEHLHISHSGARSRVQRARKLLKERMDKFFRIETDPYGNVIVCENRIPCGCHS